MIKLSIIVPIYNVKDYLRKCVDSLLHQEYEDYEIILVDDGSTDGSGQLADEIASDVRCNAGAMEDVRCIRVIHQENRGLSGARNTGIAAANGEYISFVDSDDYWEPNVLGGLMEQVKRDELDVLRFEFQNVRVRELRNEKGVKRMYEVFEPNKESHNVDCRTDVVDGKQYLNDRLGYQCYAVMFIVRRSLLNDCLFRDGIHYEDVDWTPRMMLKAKKVNSNPTIVYNYLMREGSITKGQTIEKIRKNLDDRIHVIETLNHLADKYPDCHWMTRMRSIMAVAIMTGVASDFYNEREIYIQKLKEYSVFPLVIKDQGKTFSRRAKIINICPLLFCWMMRIRTR